MPAATSPLLPSSTPLRGKFTNEQLGEPGYATTNGYARQQFDPGGLRFHDPEGALFQQKFQPHLFVGDMLKTQEAKDYANVEGIARSAGTQALRAGEADTITRSRQSAANQGLGRGYAQQAETDIRQQGTLAVTDQILAARDEENSRRYQQIAMLTESLVNANKVRFSAYLQKKAQKAARSASIFGAIGNIAGSVLGAGATLGAGALTAGATSDLAASLKTLPNVKSPTPEGR